MKKHTIRGLNVVEFGEDNSLAIVFIHAFPFCNRMWDKQVEALQGQYRVVVPDLRGFGYSEPGDGLYTIDTHVSDLISIIDSLQLEKPVICGLSMGGYIALRALELYQPKFKGAVIADTKSEADTNPFKLKRFEQIQMIRNGQRENFTEGFVKTAVSEKNYTEKPELVDFLRKMIGWQKDLTIISALLTLAARTDTTESLEKLDLPLLVMAGKDDRLTPPEFAKIIYGKTKNSEIKIIPDAGHLPNLENPDEFNKALLDFLKQFKPRDTSNVKRPPAGAPAQTGETA
jgi:pimeloyl-ACP methyl ester carboxylesterase